MVYALKTIGPFKIRQLLLFFSKKIFDPFFSYNITNFMRPVLNRERTYIGMKTGSKDYLNISGNTDTVNR